MRPNAKTLRSAPLGSLVTICGGGTPSKRVRDFYTGSIPWVTPKDMKTWFIDDTEDHITAEAVASSTTQVIEPGAVLVCIRSGVLAHTLPVAINRVSVTLNQDMKAFRCSPHLHPGYLARYLQWYSPQLLQTVRGTTAHNLSMDVVKRVEIPLPPLVEQKRIVDILDKADAIRRKRTAMTSALDNLRLSQFDEWFSPWFESAAEQDYVPVSHFVSRFEGGLNIATPEKPTPETRHFILKVSAVTWGDYRPEESKPLPPDYDPPAEHFVRKGDLLFSRANTTELVGATAFVFETPSDRVLPDKIWRFVWKNRNAVEPLFVWALFNHPRIRHDIGRRATGTSGSMKNISMKKVMAIPVPWPDVAIQSRFARFMTSERVLRSTLLASKNDSDALFNSLVQRAFRWQL